MITRKSHTIEDYERAIRRHRQNVFNENNGDLHEKAIVRLKASKIMQADRADRQARSEQRYSDKMLSLYA